MFTFRHIVLSTAALLFVLTCMAVSLLGPEPTRTPVQHPAPTRFPARTPSPTPIPPTLTAVSLPAWIDNFANPILADLATRPPDFQDDFSRLNRGWYTIFSDRKIGYFHAHIQDETLLLKLPDGAENRDVAVYNRKLPRRNFVLSLDLKFGKTEPDDTFRFQFSQTADESLYLDLSKNESWIFRWRLHNNWQSNTGTYTYFAPEYINIVVIMRGKECAVFINHDPLEYFGNCRSDSITRLLPLSQTLHLLGAPGHPAAVAVDNVKLWDLDITP